MVIKILIGDDNYEVNGHNINIDWINNKISLAGEIISEKREHQESPHITKVSNNLETSIENKIEDKYDIDENEILQKIYSNFVYKLETIDQKFIMLLAETFKCYDDDTIRFNVGCSPWIEIMNGITIKLGSPNNDQYVNKVLETLDIGEVVVTEWPKLTSVLIENYKLQYISEYAEKIGYDPFNWPLSSAECISKIKDAIYTYKNNKKYLYSTMTQARTLDYNTTDAFENIHNIYIKDINLYKIFEGIDNVTINRMLDDYEILRQSKNDDIFEVGKWEPDDMATSFYKIKKSVVV